MYQPRTLLINASRLLETLHSTCRWGAAHRYGPGPTETGMARLALSDTDKQARDWFGTEMKLLGCDVKVDAMGNMFAVRPGKKAGAPTAMGSHLDTQPTGGRYDGVLGVMAAVEGMRAVHEAGVTTEYPLAAINWTNEEGARFPKSLHGSGVWAGSLPLETAYGLRDVADESITALAELERIGYKGALAASHEANPLAAHFELHIEQGPILEANKQRIGVVSGGQAYKWFEVTITGRDSHAGTTPLSYRADALLAAARFMVAMNGVAVKHNGVATTGIMRVEPASINTIPNRVVFTVDIRHPSDSALAAMEADIKSSASEIVAQRAQHQEDLCTVSWTELFDSPATVFDSACIDAVRAAGTASAGPEGIRDIVSGAGHDSCATAKRCPTSMVFIPCRGGLSHNPREYSEPEDCAMGAQVLLDAALVYDSKRTS